MMIRSLDDASIWPVYITIKAGCIPSLLLSPEKFCQMLVGDVLLHLSDSALQFILDLCPNDLLHFVIRLLPGGKVLWRHFSDELPQHFNNRSSFGRHGDLLDIYFSQLHFIR